MREAAGKEVTTIEGLDKNGLHPVQKAWMQINVEVHIPRVDTLLDAGLVVNPEATRAQFEGAAVFGASIVRSGEITATKGAIDQ